MNDDTHVIELLPGYSLGCLDAVEADRVRVHCASCAPCRSELALLDEVTGSLALALPPAAPPRILEDRIMSRLMTGGVLSRPRPARSLPAFLRSPAWGIAAMLLVLVLAAGNVAQWVRGAAGPKGPGAPGLDTVILVGVNTGQGAYGTIVLDSKDNGGVLAMRGLPRLDVSHQYQLWLVKGQERRSGGVFTVDEDGYGNLLLTIPKDFKGFTAIGISVEPAGGSPSPTGVRVASGKL
jgi:anti-sigma-K factor RskA